LPSFDAGDVLPQFCGSRDVRRRLRTKFHETNLVSEVVTVLNAMGSMPGAPRCDLPSSAQTACLSRIEGVVKNFGPPPSGLTPAGALQELCQSASMYVDARVDVARYSEDLVSWPPSGTTAMDPLRVLSGRPHQLLSNWQQHLLCSPDEAQDRLKSSGVRAVHSDRQLVGCRRTYARFLKKMHAAGMLEWSLTAKTFVGVFFVHKKSGKQRILQTLRAFRRTGSEDYTKSMQALSF
jgi:hypothetical protein